MEKVSERLRSARLRAGYATPEEFAELAALDTATYRAYEDGTRDLPPQTGYRLAQLLNVDWIRLLYGGQHVHGNVDAGWQGAHVRLPGLVPPPREVAYVGAGRAPRAPAPPETPPIAIVDPSPSLVEPAAARSSAEPPAVPSPPLRLAAGETLAIDELDAKLASGAGFVSAGEHPLHRWRIPRELVRLDARTEASALKIVAVLGDDMEPGFRLSDRVLVDTADTRPSPPGVFLVWDGMALILRRIEIVPGSEPTQLRISADNPKYQPAQRRLSETVIQGRVLARWSWV